VASDEEAIALLKSIDAVLQQSGWKRGASVAAFPAINVLPLDTPNPYSVPVSLVNGVHISVDWPENIERLKYSTMEQLPHLLQAAVSLNSTILSNLFPPEDASQRLADVVKGDSKTVRIVIGKKP
jgi:hypothetical protein